MMLTSDPSISYDSVSKHNKSIEEDCTYKIESLKSGNNSKKKELALLYNNRGHAKYMQVEFYAAVEDYGLAILLDPKLAVAFYNRGTVNYRMGNFEAAVDDMAKALSLDPSNDEFTEGYNESRRKLIAQKLHY